MARRTIDWEAARADYEVVGLDQSSVARKYEVSRRAVQKQIEAHGWRRNVSAQIERRVAAKVAGVVAGATSEKVEQAIEAEVDRRASILLRHQRQWDEHEKLLDLAIARKDFEMAKLAKITAETIGIRQAAQRKAYGLDKPAETGDSSLTNLLGSVEKAMDYRRQLKLEEMPVQGAAE